MNLIRPPTISTSKKGTFARRTIEERKHKLIADIVSTNILVESNINKLNNLDQEISTGVIGDPEQYFFSCNLVPNEWKAWETAITPLIGKRWVELPWYQAESYFYLRVLSATGYYDKSNENFSLDPFSNLKNQELLGSGIKIASLLQDKTLSDHILFSLWGNRLDLSNYEIERGNIKNVVQGRNELIINDIELSQRKLNQALSVHIVTDNSGVELVCDLALSFYLLSNNCCQITLHVKNAPFFVSDVTMADVFSTLTALNLQEDYARVMASGLIEAINNNRLRLKEHWFWNGPQHYPDLPSDIIGELVQADLVIFKGDVNYRRLLSDRNWPEFIETKKIIDYLPFEVLILRTLKSELIVGLTKGKIKELNKVDKDWKINGKRGIIQFI